MVLSNAEAWDLSKADLTELEKIEISSLKNLFDLPVRTPTPAIIHTLGTLQTKIRSDKKQLIYLHRILTRDNGHWTRQALKTLQDLNLGWYKQIKSILEHYQMESEFEVLRNIPSAIWKSQVTVATEQKHRKEMIDRCHKQVNGVKTVKAKTASILPELEKNDYKRKPTQEILSLNKLECKTLIIARYGMLECGKNFRGTLAEKCITCDVTDNEEHRLNKCTKYSDINHIDNIEIIPFDTIYSTNVESLHKIIYRIGTVWNVRSGHGTMHT